MPPMVAYTSKVILQDDRMQQRLALLEQKCRSQEAMLGEKDAQLRQLCEAGGADPNSQLRLAMLEQQLKAHEEMMLEKDEQIENLKQLVEVAKTSMEELGTEADRETSELQNDLEQAQAAKVELEVAAGKLQEAEELRIKLQESESMCETLRNSPSGPDGIVAEVLSLRTEATQLLRRQEEIEQKHTMSRHHFRADLSSLKQALQQEGFNWPSLEDLGLSPGLEEPNVKELRERLKEVEEALESEKRLREHSQESLRECKEVAARFMADRDATRTELEELTHLASAFKTQAESELSEHRWFRLATQLRRRSEDETFEKLKGSWSNGFRKWQSFADSLTEKINQRPTAVFAQEIATNCAKGEKALQALEDKWLSQGKQLTSFAEHALAKFQQAQESWEAQLREERRLRQLAEARSRQASGDEQDPEVAEASQNLLDKSKVVDDLVASLESERKEVARLREKLSEAEQTIGQLVVQNIDTPKAKKPSLRSRTRSALM